MVHVKGDRVFIDGKNGEKKDLVGKYYVGNPYSSPAVAIDGTVYIGSTEGEVVALRWENDDVVQKWKTYVGSVRSDLAIGRDGTVYVAGYESGLLHALHGGTGEKIWKTQIGANRTSRWYSSPAIGADGTVYIGSNDGNIYALDGADGGKKWTFKTGGNVQHTSCITSDGTVIIGSADGKIYALNGASGTKKWEFNPGGKVASSCVVGSDQVVYVGFSSSKIYGLNEKDGSKKWELKLPGKLVSGGIITEAGSATMGPDGTLYAGLNDGNICAFKTSSKGPAKSPWPMPGQNPQNTRRVPNAQAPVFPSLGKKITWTASVNAKSIDQVYIMKKRAVVKEVFGKPDKTQGTWWGYTGMNITDAQGAKYSTAWFGFTSNVVQQVRFDK